MMVAKPQNLIERLQKILVFSRPVLWINTLGQAWVGLWLTGVLWDNDFLPLLLWLTLPFNFLIYGVNDISDIDTDAHNDRKGGWEGARIKRHDVSWILITVMVLNIPFLIYFLSHYSMWTNAAIAAYAGIFVIYSLPPRLKARRYFDSLSNAAYGLPLVIVPLALDSAIVWPAALGLMAWSVAKHCYDSIQDIDSDLLARLDTTAIAFGKQGAVVFCGLFWLSASFAFAAVSPSLALTNAFYSGGLLGAMMFGANREDHRRLYRYSVAFPYVVGSFGGISLALAVYLGRWVWP